MSSVGKRRGLSENEKALFDKINEHSLEELKILLNKNDVRIDCVDENGMSLLCQAAFKGDYEISKLLINNGADVNDTQHDHWYTALMFAAIGGHLKVVGLLLEAGADVHHTNSVGRTSSQMAAFVGQHEAVSMINNFVPKEDILYFSQIRGFEKTPKLDPSLVNPLWAYLRQTNIHPVRLVLELEKHPQLVDSKNMRQVIKVCDLMMEREMKKNDANEMTALKLKYISFFFEYFEKQLNQLKSKLEGKFDEKELIKKLADNLCKAWLKGRDSDGFLVNLELFLREAVKQFPYQDSMIFIEIVKTLSTVSIGDEPSALTLLSRGISGQKGYGDDVSSCTTCSEPKPSKKCSQCKCTYYCDQRCQKLHWRTHQKFCLKLKIEHEKYLAKLKKEKEEQQKQEQEEEEQKSKNSESNDANKEPNLNSLKINDSI